MDCSLNVVGFAQAIIDMMKEYGGLVIIDGADNDIRIIGTLTMIFICCICGLGAQYETKVRHKAHSIQPSKDNNALHNFFSYNIM